MVWQYNHTSRMYQRNIENGFLAITPYLSRTIEDKDYGWLPIQGLALDYLWSEGRWTCQEHLEYDPVTKKYQVGTRKWRNFRERMEFMSYQNLDLRILHQEEAFKSPEIPNLWQESITDLLRELKKKQRFKN